MLRRAITSLCLIVSFNAFATSINEGITLFNQKGFKQAKVIFEPLAKQGDARALFWLGVSQFQTGEQYEAASTLLQAAEAGNPWAMHLMVPSYNKICDYLGWPCDEGWMDKAIAEWKKRADQGDGKAMYALLRWGDKPWWAYVPVLKQKRYDALVEKAVKAGGYRAAGYMHFPITIEKRVQLLEYTASHNYAPAMTDLYYLQNKYDLKIKNPIDLLEMSLSLGYGGGASYLYHRVNKVYKTIDTVSDVKTLSTEEKNNLEETYFYALIAKGMGMVNLGFFVSKPVRDENDDPQEVTLISTKRQKEIEKRADLFLSKIKQNLYLDESSNVTALLGS